MKKWFIIFLSGAIGVGALGYLAKQKVVAGNNQKTIQSFQPPIQAVPPEIIKPGQNTAAPEISGPASPEWEVKTTVVPAQVMAVTVPQSGQIQVVHVQEGDQVQQGQCVVSLNPSTQSFDVRQAEGKIRTAQVAIERQQNLLNNSELEVQRFETLFRQGLVSQRDVDSAKLTNIDREKELERLKIELELAQATYGRTQLALDQTQITSPISGTVLRVYTTIGNAVAPGQALLEVADMSRLRVRFRVPVARARLRQGESVSLVSDQHPSPGIGIIRSISPTMFLPDNALEYEAECAASPSLNPGMTVTVRK